MANLKKNRINNKRKHRASKPYTKPVPKKKKETKKRDFESHISDTSTNKLGIKLEYGLVMLKMLFLFIGLLAGIWLVIRDIRDEGSLLKLFDIEYSGSMVGVIIALPCAIGLWSNRAKVKLLSASN